MELELSDAQREIFAGWRRPDENQADPLNEERLMAPIDGFDLVQDITTDCSVVASLCAGTARASKGHGTVSLFVEIGIVPNDSEAPDIDRLPQQQKQNRTARLQKWKIYLSLAL